MSSLTDGFYSLGADINKVGGRGDSNETAEGVVSPYLPELTLKMKDEDIISLTEKWEKKWNDSDVKSIWLRQAQDNENYWKGKQFNKLEADTQRPLVDNMVFQAVETYLPAATRQNPEPLVELRASEKQSPENSAFADAIRNRVADWADDVKIRLKLKKAGRHWLIYLVGVAKLGWDLTNNRPALKNVRPKKLILDPDAVTDEEGYNGKYIGEYRKMEASVLVRLLKEDAAAVKNVTDLAKNDMGTDIQFIEWWTTEYICWTVDKKVLLKKQNPHWNYDQNTEEPKTETPAPDDTATPAPAEGDTTEQPQTPELNTEPKPEPIPGRNHFPSARIPYVFLVIFNLGKGPVDETSLITQILPQQDLVNKREKQIDKNADGMNGGVVVSEERSGLTKEEAKQVTDALRKGGTVVIPAGAPGDAVMRLDNPALSTDIYNQLNDTRNRFYDLFGIRGITPAGIKNEDTVRGKIITKGLDTDRIGGGITEYFEQFADDIYNWVVQLYYVYDDLFVNNPNANLPKLKVSVKEGSLLPKDATTLANQAIELANAGKMSLIDLYKRLEMPNPEEMAANMWLEANAPEIMFKDDPRVMEAIKMKQQQAMQMAQAEAAGKAGAPKGPSESISFKDLPVDGKVQMAKQAGIELHPAVVAAHDESNKAPPDELKKVPIEKHQNG